VFRNTWEGILLFMLSWNFKSNHKISVCKLYKKIIQMFVRRWTHFQGYYETTNICCCQNFTIFSSFESLCIFYYLESRRLIKVHIHSDILYYYYKVTAPFYVYNILISVLVLFIYIKFCKIHHFSWKHVVQWVYPDFLGDILC
jgi:hypothetical protein